VLQPCKAPIKFFMKFKFNQRRRAKGLHQLLMKIPDGINSEFVGSKIMPGMLRVETIPKLEHYQT